MGRRSIVCLSTVNLDWANKHVLYEYLRWIDGWVGTENKIPYLPFLRVNARDRILIKLSHTKNLLSNKWTSQSRSVSKDATVHPSAWNDGHCETSIERNRQEAFYCFAGREALTLAWQTINYSKSKRICDLSKEIIWRMVQWKWLVEWVQPEILLFIQVFLLSSNVSSGFMAVIR